jgi:hypothetical protein
MPERLSLKEAERKAFTSAFGDGLLDIFIGGYMLLFILALFLSESLGDFWSSAVLVPIWGILYLVLWLIRRSVIRPRIGVVKFGAVRIARLKKFNLIMLVALTVALLLGVLSAVDFERVPGWVHSARFGLVFLIGFSLAGYFLNINRLYLYGVLIALAPPVGEWLYATRGASHHGIPITFGFTGSVMILTGIVFFIRLLRDHPLPPELSAFEESQR